MGNGWTILGLIAAIIALAFIFPESLKTVLENKLYIFGLILTSFLIIFFIFIKIHER